MLEDFLTRPWLTSLLPKGSCRNFNKRFIFNYQHCYFKNQKLSSIEKPSNVVLKVSKVFMKLVQSDQLYTDELLSHGIIAFYTKMPTVFPSNVFLHFLSNICNISQLHLSDFVIKFKRSSEFVSAIKFHPYNSNCLG